MNGLKSPPVFDSHRCFKTPRNDAQIADRTFRALRRERTFSGLRGERAFAGFRGERAVLDLRWEKGAFLGLRGERPSSRMRGERAFSGLCGGRALPPLARRPRFPSLPQKKAPGNSQIRPRKAAEAIELTRANYSPRVRFKLSTDNSSKIAHEELNISDPILRKSP